MNHIQRIGNIPQEFTNAGSCGIGRFAGGSPKHDERKQENATNRIVQTVHPQMLVAANPGNSQ